MTITWIGANSANFQKGRNGSTVSKVVIHWIVGKLAAADATFQDPKRIASAHYGVGNKVIHQYVKEEDTAYHAGNLTVNRQSIGIEHEGGPDLPISEETYKTSAQLVADICRRYAIPVDRTHIIKHSEVKATQCPGTLDIDRLVSMVGSILAPVQDNDLQVELDKVRGERDRNWTWFSQVCAALGVGANVETAIAEAKKLTTLEDAIQAKDRQLQEANTRIADLEAKLTEATRKNEELQTIQATLQEKTDEQTKVIQEQGMDIKSLTIELQSLKEDVGHGPKTGWQLILEGIGRLFRK